VEVSSAGVSVGGGVLLVDYTIIVNIDNCIFSGNRAYSPPSSFYAGGGVIFNLAVLNITNTQFIGNTAEASPGGFASGGAIENSGSLNIRNCLFEGNEVLGNGSGGAIAGGDSGHYIFQSEFRNNKVIHDSGRGGAVLMNDGTLQIDSCRFTGNEASFGGAISSERATTSISRSTIDSNLAISSLDAAGGGIYIEASNNVQIDRCTVSGNTVIAGGASNGGGIASDDAGFILFGGGFTIKRSTITNNSAAEGGGLYLSNSSISAFIDNILLAGNTAGNFDDLQLSAAPLTSNGYNLIGNLDGTGLTASAGDLFGTASSPINPGLYALADNGGGFFTHDLDPCSPAYNAGDPADFSPDQIGQFVFDGIRDIGAFENQMGGCAPVCLTATPPQNTNHLIVGSTVKLQWDAVSNSVACQVRGTRISPPGPTGTQIIFGSEPTSTNVPFAALGLGTSWSWKVRCACSTSPLTATAFSLSDTFTTAVLAKQENAVRHLDVFPNPVADVLNINLKGYGSDAIDIVIQSADGRTVLKATQIIASHSETVSLDVAALAKGYYYVSVRGDMGVEILPFLKLE
jgi:hypothetical protein